jgi:hypothetical protein
MNRTKAHRSLTGPTGRPIPSMGSSRPKAVRCLVSPAHGPPAETPPQPSGWRTVPDAPIAARMRHGAVWTGGEMIVWGGQGDRLVYGDDAAYRPA